MVGNILKGEMKMSNWNNYVHETMSTLQPGDYRVEIVSAEEKTSKSGKPMIVVGIKPNGSGITINEYFVQGDFFNRKMSGFFDAFPQINDGDFNFIGWVGCVGAARLKQDGDYLRVHFFLSPKQAEKLPEWQGAMPERQTVTSFEEVTDDGDDLPF